VAAPRPPVAERADQLERQLDAVLAPRGHHLLHGCVWPGDERATIDHVVIGPSGAWVIIERAVGARSSLTRVAAQAQAVSTALGGVPVGAILAVFDGDVPGGHIVHDGVTIAIADVPTMDVIVDAPTRMGRIEIARYAELAINRLRPLAVTEACLAGTPDSIPMWEPKSTSAVAVPRTRGRRWWLLAVPALAALAVAGAYVVRPNDTTETPASPIAVAFECRTPGAGWTAVITWPDLEDVHALLLSPTLEGPWAAVPGPVREGIEPGQHSFVRVQYGTGMEANTEVTAPKATC
jgi:hypothetical protein